MPTDILDRLAGSAAAIAPGAVAEEARDTDLVAAAKSGSAGAFDVLVKRHTRKFLRIAQRVTRNREDAQDVVQKSFQKAFVHVRKFEERASFSTWLTRIVINEAAMCLRKNRRARVLPIDELGPHEEPAPALQVPDLSPSPEQAYSRLEAERILSFGIRQLSPGLRAVIQLYYLDERSLTETAQVMGLSVEAVKSRVLRGRRHLRETLERFMRPSRRFGYEALEISAHINAASLSSPARFPKAKSNGGGHGDNSTGSCAHHLGVAVARRSRRWKRIESFSMNRA
jgi:RNA polymerase sigma-70 factor (ECF subfamily)